MTHDRSREVMERARRVLPGGVDSPVRAYKAVGGEPVVLASGAGARVVDVDGNEYIDYVGSFGPLILGHAHPAVVAAVQDAADARHLVRRADRGGGRARRAHRRGRAVASRWCASSTPAPRRR